MKLNWTSGGLAVACLVALSCAFGCAVQSQTGGDGPLLLDKTQGKAPLGVTVMAPADLANFWADWQKRGCVHSMWGDGFWIDWGDGTGDGDKASRMGADPPIKVEIGRHNFATAGTYTVSAALYRHMPDDSHKEYWRGQTTVTVQAK